MLNLEFKYPNKAATVTLSQLVINHNDMSLRVNPMTVCLDSTV
jgi:dihydroorotase